MTRGTYVLLTHVPYNTNLGIGGLGAVEFGAGYYAYVGSALGGLEKRVGRHLKSEKKLHWHIDHLLLRARAVDVVLAESEKRMECGLAKEMSKELLSIEGFGSSDCDCKSHLFYNPDFHKLIDTVLKAFKACGLTPSKGVRA